MTLPFARILGLILLSQAQVLAQLPFSQLDAVFPPGGQLGQTVEVQLHGAHLIEIDKLYTSNPAIKGYVKNGKYRIEIPSDATPGVIDVRAAGRFGVSNARAFVVSPIPQIDEKTPNQKQAEAMPIEIGQAVNGTASSQALDWFQFVVTDRLPLRIEVHAERIDSRMDPTLILYDERGREIMRSRDMAGVDPVLDFSPPKEGKYFIATHDFLFKGDHNHFYRLSLTRADDPTLNTPARRVAELALAKRPKGLTQTIDTLPARIAGEIPTGQVSKVAFTAKESGKVWVQVFSERLGYPSDFRLKVMTDGKKIVEDDDLDDPVRIRAFPTGSRDPSLAFDAKKDVHYEFILQNQFTQGGRYELVLTRANPGFELIAAAQRPSEMNNNRTRWVPTLRAGGIAHWDVFAVRQDGFNGAIDIRLEGLPEGVAALPSKIAKGQHKTTLLLQAAEDLVPWSGPIKITGNAVIGEQSVTRPAHGAEVLWTIGDFNNERSQTRLTSQPFLNVIGQEPAPIALKPKEAAYESCLAGTLDIPFTITRDIGQAGNFKMRLMGLPGLNSPKEINFDPNAKETKITLDLANKDNNKFTPGVYRMNARAWEGKVRHRYRPELADKAAAEHKALEEKAKQLAEELTKLESDQALTDEERTKAVTTKKQEVEAANKARDEAAKRAEEAKKQAEPKEIVHTFYSHPFTLKITEGPMRFVSLPEKVSLTPGADTEIKVGIERLYGFAEAVKVEVSPPKDSKLFEPASADIAKDQTEATLKLKADQDAKRGEYSASVALKVKYRGQDLAVSTELPISSQ